MSYHRPYTACVYQLSVVNLLSFQMQKFWTQLLQVYPNFTSDNRRLSTLEVLLYIQNSQVDMQNDWKLLTIFIGTNDLCLG